MSDDFDNDSEFAHAPDPQKKNANSSKKHKGRRRIVQRNGWKCTYVNGRLIKREPVNDKDCKETAVANRKASKKSKTIIEEHLQTPVNKINTSVSADKISALVREFADIKVPEEVKTARNEEASQNKVKTDQKIEKSEEQEKSACASFGEIETSYLCLFYSFDIVNSTAYKSVTIWWPVIIMELIQTIRKRVTGNQELANSQMWRVIGDEVIFVLPIQNKTMLVSSIDSIFKLLQEMVRSLKNGNFIENIDNQQAKKDTALLKDQTQMLSLKCAAWIAAVSDSHNQANYYNNISFDYPGTSQSPEMHEFLGRDIDAGFRVKQETMDRRLALSFELAYLLKDIRRNCLYIIDYVRLKGVWENSLYPVVWYYNEEIIRSIYENTDNYHEYNKSEYSFANSFRYDETEGNDLVINYFARGKMPRKKKNGSKGSQSPRTQIEKDGVLLPSGMFSVDKAFDKIARDRNLSFKMDYLKELFTDKVLIATSIKKPLELHLAVVCYDPETHKVMIARRSENHSLNPRKWDFGCAKALSRENIIDTVNDYYLHTFGLHIELVLDKTRNERQPQPLAIYEIKKHGHIKKGLILMAVVKNKTEFHDSSIYEETKWVNYEESKQIKEDDAVIDFHNTIKRVFSYEDRLLKDNMN
jgi:hypothetical protein